MSSVHGSRNLIVKRDSGFIFFYFCKNVKEQSSLFVFLLGFLFAEGRPRSGGMIKTSNKAALGRNFQI